MLAPDLAMLCNERLLDLQIVQFCIEVTVAVRHRADKYHYNVVSCPVFRLKLIVDKLFWHQLTGIGTNFSEPGIHAGSKAGKNTPVLICKRIQLTMYGSRIK